jgi:hypothetical protein
MQNERTILPQERYRHPNEKIFWKFFWGTVVVLLCITIFLAIFRWWQDRTEPEVELDPTLIEILIMEAAEKADDSVRSDVKLRLDRVYAPVYEAIPDYASFHYSVLGEYTELTSALLGGMANTLHDQLYNGFDQRYLEAAEKIDQKYAEAFSDQLAKLIAAKTGSSPDQTLGPLTKTILEDAKNRVKFDASIVAAAATGVGVMKATMAVAAKKLTTKIAAKAVAKAAAKGAAKIGGAGTGLATGTLLCAWSGPFAAACGVAGAVVGWLAVDTAVVNLDEYFNRDEFEADLRNIINKDREKKTKFLEALLSQKSCNTATEKNDFTLKGVADENSLPAKTRPPCHAEN